MKNLKVVSLSPNSPSKLLTQRQVTNCPQLVLKQSKSQKIMYMVSPPSPPTRFPTTAG